MIKNCFLFVVFALFNLLAAPLSPAGNAFPLYVGNDGNSEIVRLDASGNQTVFSSVPAGFYPEGMAMDTQGNLYVVVFFNANIVKIDPSGNQTVFYQDTSGLFFPRSLAFDAASGNLYVISSTFTTQTIDRTNKVLKLDPQGNATVVYSNANTDGILLCDPSGLAFDGSGNVYIGNEGPIGVPSTILKIDPSGHATVFSSGNYLGGIAEMTFDALGTTLYVGDSPTFNTSNPVILKIDASGNQTVFSSNNATQGSLMSNPGGMAFDSNGNLYVNQYNAGGTGRIVKLDANGNQTVFASGSNIYYPYGLAFTVQLTPAQQITKLETTVGSLITAGTINGGQGNALIGPLTRAQHFLNAGQTHQAINQLQAFLTNVQGLIGSGALTSAQGQPLIDAANAAIHSLGG